MAPLTHMDASWPALHAASPQALAGLKPNKLLGRCAALGGRQNAKRKRGPIVVVKVAVWVMEPGPIDEVAIKKMVLWRQRLKASHVRA